jgi:hypothetical protein
MVEYSRFLLPPLLLCAVLLPGCSEPVLEGPNYPAEDAPWISSDYTSDVEEIEVQSRLVLIGDAGLYLENDPTLAALTHWADAISGSTVLFLGDNIYDDGMVEEKREEAERILGQQMAAVRGRKVVIPGNHDWGMNPAEQNINAILNQQAYIDTWPAGNAIYTPRDGCIGPEKVLLADGKNGAPRVVLLLLDPTPFMSPELRELCPRDSSDHEHFAALEKMLADHADDLVVVASHYPMITGGPHGGLSYGFPLEILVSFFGWLYGGLGNTYEPLYAEWIGRTKEVFRTNPPLLYAAGHDHNLQILESSGEVGVHVVSGAGAPERVSTVTNIPQTIFAHAAPGFFVLDFGKRDSGPVMVLRVIENGFDDPVFEMEIQKPQ